ncbi:hypothetical protein S245_024388, partial [Arachis hypogaea]
CVHGSRHALEVLARVINLCHLNLIWKMKIAMKIEMESKTIICCLVSFLQKNCLSFEILWHSWPGMLN